MSAVPDAFSPLTGTQRTEMPGGRVPDEVLRGMMSKERLDTSLDSDVRTRVVA